ncbi:hypothetical protein, partial [Bacillus cereus]
SSNAFEDGVKKVDGHKTLIRREIERLYLLLNANFVKSNITSSIGILGEKFHLPLDEVSWASFCCNKILGTK